MAYTLEGAGIGGCSSIKGRDTNVNGQSIFSTIECLICRYLTDIRSTNTETYPIAPPQIRNMTTNFPLSPAAPCIVIYQTTIYIL